MSASQQVNPPASQSTKGEASTVPPKYSVSLSQERRRDLQTIIERSAVEVTKTSASGEKVTTRELPTLGSVLLDAIDSYIAQQLGNQTGER